MESKFPNNEIIELYLSNEDNDDFGTLLSWKSPEVEMLVDFLVYHQHWEPSYIRQRMFPMFSTISMRERASSTTETLLHGQYEFVCIQRLKVRYGHQFYEVKWRKSGSMMDNVNEQVSPKGTLVAHAFQAEKIEIDESTRDLDELDVPQFQNDGGCWYIWTDENLELVHNAYPEKVDSFLRQKEMKDSKRKKRNSSRCGGTCGELQTSNPGGIQLAITDYYRSRKSLNEEKDDEDLAQNTGTRFAKEISKVTCASLPKSVRRRLLFD